MSSQPSSSRAMRQWLGILLSGGIILLSFVSFIIPLASYHLAQAAAIHGKRHAALLLLGIVVVGFLFGAMGQQIMLMGGLMALLWTPILLTSIVLRQSGKGFWFTVFINSLPVLFILWMLFFTPTYAHIQDFVAQAQQQLAQQDSSQNFIRPLQALVDTPNLQPLRQWLGYTVSQRLLWLTYGEGFGLLFFVIFTCFGNLFLLNFAFTQVERIRSLLTYAAQSFGKMDERVQEFLKLSKHMLGLRGYGSSSSKNQDFCPAIVQHKIVQPLSESEAWKGVFIAPSLQKGWTRFLGYDFEIKTDSLYWHMKYFRLPLVTVVLALSCVVSLFLVWGQNLVEWLQVGNPPPPQSSLFFLAGFLGFIVLVVLAMQGALSLYNRLRPLAVLIGVFCIGLTVIQYGFPAHMLLGLLGCVGLLDYLYRFRP